MYSKSEVLNALTTMSRIMREVKALDNETKRLISVNAGCSQTEVDECENTIDQITEHVRNEMIDFDSIESLDIDAHFTPIDNALENMSTLDDRHQSILVKTMLTNCDAFEADINELNELLHEAEKNWYVIHTNEAIALRDITPEGMRYIFDGIKE